MSTEIFSDSAKKTGISIIIPVYNARSYLIDAIDSVYCQGLQRHEFEIIIVDDQSDQSVLAAQDEHQKWLKEVKRRQSLGQYPNLRIIPSNDNLTNVGQAAAKNAGLSAAQFPFIACLDADDMYAYEPDFLKEYGSFLRHGIDVLSQNGTIALVDCNVYRFGANIDKSQAGVLNENEGRFHQLAVNNNVISNKAVFRKSDALNEHVNGFPTNWPTAEDYAFFMQLLDSRIKRQLMPNVHCLADAHYLYRQHSKTFKNVSARPDPTLETRMQMLRRRCTDYVSHVRQTYGYDGYDGSRTRAASPSLEEMCIDARF